MCPDLLRDKRELTFLLSVLGELCVFYSLVSGIYGLVGMTKECKRNVRGKINSLVRQNLYGRS